MHDGRFKIVRLGGLDGCFPLTPPSPQGRGSLTRPFVGVTWRSWLFGRGAACLLRFGVRRRAYAFACVRSRDWSRLAPGVSQKAAKSAKNGFFWISNSKELEAEGFSAAERFRSYADYLYR